MLSELLETRKKILTLKGIGKLRASHLIQLASFLGVIPLHYYVFLPSHLEGGTGKFLTNQLGFENIHKSDKNTLMEKHCQEMNKLQQIYGCNFTSNMFENMCCILGRDENKVTYDIYYYLPWVKNKLLTDTTTIQLTFRIKVYSMKKIVLTCKSDDKETPVNSTIEGSLNQVITYNKEPYDSSNKNLLLLSKSGHKINNDWMNSQYVNTVFDKIEENASLHDIRIPTFETWYDKVRSYF